jgi:pimeloyl-ACP methyl ester carboxylesterase
MKLIILMMSLFFAFSAFAIKVPAGFKKETVRIDGMSYNVYRGGTGEETLVLLHGYAQSALMWHKAMEHYKDKYSLIVPDLRGAGLTDAPESGYDKVTMAGDIKKILDHYSITKAKVVGHDIGLMVAYSLAATYPNMVEKLALMDAFIPGVVPGDEIYNSPDIWHFRFHGPYAEKLVKGREYIYFDALWSGFSANPKTFPEADKKQYASEYARPGRMQAGFAWFKAFPADALTNKELAKTKLKMPVLALGGEKANGQGLVDTMKAAAENVQPVIVANCGHWMMEECPTQTLEALDAFLGAPAVMKQAEEAKEE